MTLLQLSDDNCRATNFADISVVFHPMAYYATEGVDSSITLMVARTGNTSIQVTATVMTVSETAEGMEQECKLTSLCAPVWSYGNVTSLHVIVTLFQQMEETI